VRVAQRDRVLQHLSENGIGAGIHYPIPIHLQGAYADLGKGPGSFPVAERAADEILSLPMFAGITEIQQEHTVEVLRQALGRSGRLSAAG
jgi:dTDP-4-amino-4,6-dideoxygalactose transaminase